MVQIVGAIAFLCVISAIAVAYLLRNSAQQNIALIDRALLTGGQIPDWEPRLKTTLWWFPRNDQAWLQLGYFLARDERFSEAAAAYERVTPESEFHREASFSRAKSLLSDGQYELGESALREHVAIHSRSPEGWDLYYQLLSEQFRQDELIEALKVRVMADPASLQFLPLHFKAVADFPMPQKLEARLIAVNEKHPNQPTVVAALGRAAWLKGDRTRASRFFSDLLKNHGLRSRFILWSAEFALETQDLNQAEATLAKITSPSELTTLEAASYWTAKSRLAVLHKQFELALEHVDRAIEQQPRRASAHALRATVLRYLKRLDEATESNATAARIGTVDEELTRLASTLGNTPPTPAVSGRVAELFQQIGHDEVAKVWIRLEKASRSQLLDMNESP